MDALKRFYNLDVTPLPKYLVNLHKTENVWNNVYIITVTIIGPLAWAYHTLKKFFNDKSNLC